MAGSGLQDETPASGLVVSRKRLMEHANGKAGMDGTLTRRMDHMRRKKVNSRLAKTQSLVFVTSSAVTSALVGSSASRRPGSGLSFQIITNGS